MRDFEYTEISPVKVRSGPVPNFDEPRVPRQREPIVGAHERTTGAEFGALLAESANRAHQQDALRYIMNQQRSNQALFNQQPFLGGGLGSLIGPTLGRGIVGLRGFA